MAYPPRPSIPGMAIAAISTGIAGLLLTPCLSFLPVLPVLAIVLGHLSLARINRGDLPGRGLAVTGLVTGYIGVALSILLLVLIIIGTISSPTPSF